MEFSGPQAMEDERDHLILFFKKGFITHFMDGGGGGGTGGGSCSPPRLHNAWFPGFAGCCETINCELIRQKAIHINNHTPSHPSTNYKKCCYI